MKLVPKPEGFELRDKRSDRHQSASLWQVGDALYDASKEIEKQDAEAVFICWRERKEDGSFVTHFRTAGPEGAAMSLVLNAVGRYMGWRD